jgi:hypothetical protein
MSGSSGSTGARSVIVAAADQATYAWNEKSLATNDALLIPIRVR